MTCKERLRGLACSLSAENPHDIHLAICHIDGTLLARWRMIAQELPIADAIPSPVAGGEVYERVL